MWHSINYLDPCGALVYVRMFWHNRAWFNHGQTWSEASLKYVWSLYYLCSMISHVLTVIFSTGYICEWHLICIIRMAAINFFSCVHVLHRSCSIGTGSLRIEYMYLQQLVFALYLNAKFLGIFVDAVIINWFTQMGLGRHKCTKLLS